MVKTSLYYGNYTAAISAGGAQLVSVTETPPPPVGTPNKLRDLSGILGSSGLNSGILNQRVDGSTTPQEFYVKSAKEYDLHIYSISILIADTSISSKKFGNINELSVGWDLVLREDGTESFLIEKATTCGQVLVYSGGNKFGSGNGVNKISSWTDNDDAFFVDIPIYVPNGLRIGRGSENELVSVVNDNLIGLEEFQVAIRGYKNYPILEEG